MTTTVSFVVFLLSMAAIPGSLLAKGKMTASDAQPPEIKIMPSANQLPEIIIAVNPSRTIVPSLHFDDDEFPQPAKAVALSGYE